MDRPPHTGLEVSGRPSLADGLPKTAMPATCSGASGGSGLLNLYETLCEMHGIAAIYSTPEDVTATLRMADEAFAVVKNEGL